MISLLKDIGWTVLAVVATGLVTLASACGVHIGSKDYDDENYFV